MGGRGEEGVGEGRKVVMMRGRGGVTRTEQFQEVGTQRRFNTDRDGMVDVRLGQPITACGHPPAKGSHTATLMGGSGHTREVIRETLKMSDGLFSKLVS